jgi:hypothetical protein
MVKFNDTETSTLNSRAIQITNELNFRS